jgi:membrane-bound lytic murein transglycosylase B
MEDDVFASTANYLSKSGWREGERWGREVLLTQRIPANAQGLEIRKSLAEWARLGVKLPGGAPLPTVEGMSASLIEHDGPGGNAFLVYDNFRVIMKWNKSKYFASSVGLLSDQIRQ